jgi:all-trans-retinol dehydrogenase (NAD+)
MSLVRTILIPKQDNVHYFSCDITSPNAVKEAAGVIRGFLGSPTILINNAGIAYAHTILETSPNELRKIFDVNLISQFYTIQAFLPEMIKQKKGHIISIASMASFVTPPELVDYCTTKAGVLALHEGLNQELKHRYDAPEIKTTVVHPTYVNTKLVNPYIDSLKKSKALIIEPETVANAVVKQILSGKSGQICLPQWLGAATLARGFPWWLQEVVRDGTKGDIVAAVKEGSK